MSNMLIKREVSVDLLSNTRRFAGTSFSFAPSLVLAMLLSAPAVNAQTMPPQPGPTSANPPLRGDDITRQDVADFNWFLDRHPEIAEQLRKDPSLIDNHRFVADHPQLQEYVQTHRKIADAFRTHPDQFMRDEERYERNQGGDITRRDVLEMNHFLDDHKEIAEQLRKDPSLIDNREWVSSHPALQEYLQSHPAVKEAFRSDPNAFMHDEERLDRREGEPRDAGRMNANSSPYDRDERNRGELTGFGQFLGGHSSVADELSRDPSLANNREYLENHPELNDYLKSHPAMSQQLSENPQAVMNSNWVQKSGGFTAKPVGPSQRSTSNPNPNQ
jgi:hypothetical protein